MTTTRFPLVFLQRNASTNLSELAMLEQKLVDFFRQRSRTTGHPRDAARIFGEEFGAVFVVEFWKEEISAWLADIFSRVVEKHVFLLSLMGCGGSGRTGRNFLCLFC